MKTARKITAISLALILLLCMFSSNAAAQSESVVVKMMNYNVAGMPSFNGTGAANHKIIADYIVENDFDIVAVQEDFAYNKSLVSNLDGFDYFTNHAGSIPGGDGLNIFSDGMPLYNEERRQWNDSFGHISEGDILTPKGILYTVVEISDGVYIDLYNIHADAFETSGSVLARESNFNQLAAMIEENCKKHDRPVIVTGDFNCSLHEEETSNMYSIFQERLGMKDAWIELVNNGDYNDFSVWEETEQLSWGTWDSVEKFLYRDGGGITVTALEFKYDWLHKSADETLSDHAAAECVFEFTVTDDFTANDQELEIVKVSPLRNLFNTVKWIFKDLFYFLSHLGELIEFFGEGPAE